MGRVTAWSKVAPVAYGNTWQDKGFVDQDKGNPIDRHVSAYQDARRRKHGVALPGP